MKILTKRQIKHMESNINHARNHGRSVKEIKRNAENKTNDVVVPTEKELALLHDMLDQLKELNNLTFEYAEQIEELEQDEQKNLSNLNQARIRNERANKKAWNMKKQLKRKLNKYTQFNVAIPKDRYGHTKYVTYKYNRVDEDIKKLIREVDQSYSEGEKLVKDMMNIFKI